MVNMHDQAERHNYLTENGWILVDNWDCDNIGNWHNVSIDVYGGKYVFNNGIAGVSPGPRGGGMFLRELKLKPKTDEQYRLLARVKNSADPINAILNKIIQVGFDWFGHHLVAKTAYTTKDKWDVVSCVYNYNGENEKIHISPAITFQKLRIAYGGGEHFYSIDWVEFWKKKL